MSDGVDEPQLVSWLAKATQHRRVHFRAKRLHGIRLGVHQAPRSGGGETSYMTKAKYCSQCHEEIGECECPRCARCRAFVPRDGETPCSRCGYDGSQSLTPTPPGGA